YPWRVSHLRPEKFRKLFPDADKYLDAIQQSFPYLVPDPVIPAADEYQRKLSFEITQALAKRKAPKDALDSAAKDRDKITERPERTGRQSFQYRVAVAKAIGSAFDPRKMNYELLGNTVGHLHWNLFPGYEWDPNPKGPTWETNHPPRLPSSEEYVVFLPGTR